MPSLDISADASPLSTIIIDHEQLAAEALLELLQPIDDIDVLACCSHAFDAIELLNSYKPDLIIMDYQLPVMSGLELLKQLEQSYRPKIIIVSALQESIAVDSHAHLIDWLLKPVQQTALLQAITKACADRESHMA